MIVCYLSITGLSQSDTTYTFTQSQVKEFLITKVELNNCREQYGIILQKNNNLNLVLKSKDEEIIKEKSKTKRNRIFAIICAGAASVTTSILLIKK